MIFCKRSELNKYLGISACFDEAIHAALNCDLSHMEIGHIDFSQNVYGNCTEYETCDSAKLLYETHRKYADIHMVVYGTEMVYLADTTKQECVESDATNDYIGTCGDWDSCVRLTTEDVLVVFPGEAHKLRGMLEEPEKVRKLVIKFPQITE